MSREDYLARLTEQFHISLHSLHVTADVSDGCNIDSIESMSAFIYDSMSNKARNYHRVQHIFDVLEGNFCRTNNTNGGDCMEPVLDATAVLAVLFHDCVYQNVDGGLSVAQSKRLQNVICTEENTITTATTNDAKHPLHYSSCQRIYPEPDPLVRLVMGIFGFQPNQILSTGENEFLSAVIAVRELEALLPIKTLAQIAVCIEATIPFRDVDPVSGETALERLYTRLYTTVQMCAVDMTEEDCVEAVQRAALVSNEDIGNFGSTDHAYFLDNTWSLLPELNPFFQETDLYTVHEYLFAMYSLHEFFNFVKPNVVFQDFCGVPYRDIKHRLTQNATRNLSIGGRYVAAKLLTSAVIAAISEQTGGDTPIDIFLGTLWNRKQWAESLRLDPCNGDAEFCDNERKYYCPDVYDLLINGRTRETSFDVRQSPMSAKLYSCIGDTELKRLLESIQVYPMTPDVSTKLLAAVPRSAMDHLVELLLAISARKDEISSLLQSLSSSTK